jgi:hypothetical protein
MTSSPREAAIPRLPDESVKPSLRARRNYDRAMRLALILCTSLLFAPTAAAAPCTDALAQLRSDDGRDFVARRYGIGRWEQKTDRGRLPYAVHVWEGTLGAQKVFLNFTAIPGTSGPNWGSERKLSAYRAKIAWQKRLTFELPEEFRVYAGPVAGVWKVTCQAPTESPW